jgi:hypothetical protein
LGIFFQLGETDTFFFSDPGATPYKDFMVDLTVRYLGGDKSLAPEINTNANSNTGINQAARAQLESEGRALGESKKRADADSEPETLLVKKTKRSKQGEGMDLDSMQMFQFPVGSTPKDGKDIMSSIAKISRDQIEKLKQQNRHEYELEQMKIMDKKDERADNAKMAAAERKEETKRAEILAKAKVEEARAAAEAEVKKAEAATEAKKAEEETKRFAMELEYKFKMANATREEKSEAKKKSKSSNASSLSIFNEPDREPGKAAKVPQKQIGNKGDPHICIHQLLDILGIKDDNYRKIDDLMKKEYKNIHYIEPKTLQGGLGLYHNQEIRPLYDLAMILMERKRKEEEAAAAAATEADGNGAS